MKLLANILCFTCLRIHVGESLMISFARRDENSGRDRHMQDCRRHRHHHGKSQSFEHA